MKYSAAYFLFQSLQSVLTLCFDSLQPVVGLEEKELKELDINFLEQDASGEGAFDAEGAEGAEDDSFEVAAGQLQLFS